MLWDSICILMSKTFNISHCHFSTQIYFLSKLHHAQNAHRKLAENGSLFKRDVSVQLLVITAAVDHPTVEKRSIRSCGVQASVLSAF